MAKFEPRVPKQSDTIMVAGRTGSFAVIGIDSINKTVEVRAASAPFGVVIAPWVAISYVS
jgi:hypothetical protein